MPKYIDAEKLKITCDTFIDEDGEILVPLREVRKMIEQATVEESVNGSGLKPCPFCGGTAKMYDNYHELWFVSCEDCGSETAECDTEKGAIEAWNRRAP